MPRLTIPGRRPTLCYWMMIIDLRRYDGRRSLGVSPRCTEACIQGHFVAEPMDWLGTPHAEGAQALEIAARSCAEGLPRESASRFRVRSMRGDQ